MLSGCIQRQLEGIQRQMEGNTTTNGGYIQRQMEGITTNGGYKNDIDIIVVFKVIYIQ